MNAEQIRLEENRKGKSPWKKWGPYVAERQWGTVREDYSPHGNAWEYFPHDDARSRAYRWGEDGIGGICDEDQKLCFSLALWNGVDPILKERLFGLTGNEGNHGEDVKEIYYYLDNTPTHSYMKMLYKYPQKEYPYRQLVEENQRRDRAQPEYELLDTGIFDEDRYFDVFIEYAKANPEDFLIKLTVSNRGPESSTVHLLPHIWFRNTWSWGRDPYKPSLALTGPSAVEISHKGLGEMFLYCEGDPAIVFCDNETNPRRLFGMQDASGFFKDGINDFIVQGAVDSVNPSRTGTKAAAIYKLDIPAGQSVTVLLRLTSAILRNPFDGFEEIVRRRKHESDEFYLSLQPVSNNEDAKNVFRQTIAGMLWSKQFYYYDIPQWLAGDPAQPPPPNERMNGRNREWLHLNNANVISMPDKWEYPWYATWDLAFHCIALAQVDVEFAKDQLILLTREWFMHPNGQLPAYEWALGDVNPPVQAWAAWRIYDIEKQKNNGTGDTEFLQRVFHKLLLNFTWWVNRKDAEGRNIFQGGFLGLDNIGVFDRSASLPTGGHIEQADGTSWMAFYSLCMLQVSLELAMTNKTYEDLATKFFEHFLYIAGAMANIGGEGIDMWDKEDEFYYDVLHCPDGSHVPLKVRSLVGLIPLFAVNVIDPEVLEQLPAFKNHLEWFLHYRPDLASLISRWQVPGKGERRLLSLLRGHRLKKLLQRMLDESEFLSEYGIRALSKYHKEHPYMLTIDGHTFSVNYQPGESQSGLFGGNSNWRGPIWFPVNYLMIESLKKFHSYYGDDFRVEYPTGSGQFRSLGGVAEAIEQRLTNIFLRDENSNRPVLGSNVKLRTDPHFRDYILFHEYFHADTGAGLGASHQTGWTGLVANMIVHPNNQ